MTGRRPQDPRTKKVREPEADIPTMGPEVEDPNATSMPDQRNIETFDPGATVMPLDIEAPKPRMVRGGAAATRVPGSTGVDRTITADSMAAARVEVRAKAAAGGGIAEVAPRPQKKGTSWALWLVAFLVLGGIGFGVAWFVMNPSGGGDVAAAPAAEDASAAVDDAVAAADATEAADAGAGDAAAVAGADAAGEVAVAAVDVAAVAAVDVVADAAAAVGDTAAVAVVDVASVVAADTQVAGVATVDVAAAAPATPDVAPAEVAVAPKPIVRNPIEATRLNEDGLARRKAGDHAGAQKLYEQALVADPEHVWARYNYACELALAGRAKDALNELTSLYKFGTADARRALGAARKDSDFRSIKDSGQFFRLTNF